MTSNGYLKRRDFLKLAVILSGGTFLYWLRLPLKKMNVTRPTRLGTTFSQLQCRYLGINYKEAFEEIRTMGFDVIRLCTYWNEIEPKEGIFDFETLDWLIEACQKSSLEIVLTIGMKAPRWPEFHFPKWIEEAYDTTQTNRPLDSDLRLADRTLTFVDRVVEHTRSVSNIQYWQVENEAINKPEVARGRFLSQEFLQKELDILKPKIHPQQKIMLTNAISLLPVDIGHDERAFDYSLTIADVVGLNVYTKVPLGPKLYMQPIPAYWRKIAKWQRKIVGLKKEAWIAEAQAEPWEWNKLTATEKLEYPSTSPNAATDLVIELAKLGYESVLLWGCEYWYWQKKQGSDNWWDAITQLIEKRK